jgi:hypothetical protein
MDEPWRHGPCLDADPCIATSVPAHDLLDLLWD